MDIKELKRIPQKKMEIKQLREEISELSAEEVDNQNHQKLLQKQSRKLDETWLQLLIAYDAIDTLSDPVLRVVARYHYIEQKNYVQISLKTGYSISSVKRFLSDIKREIEQK